MSELDNKENEVNKVELWRYILNEPMEWLLEEFCDVVVVKVYDSTTAREQVEDPYSEELLLFLQAQKNWLHVVVDTIKKYGYPEESFINDEVFLQGDYLKEILHLQKDVYENRIFFLQGSPYETSLFLPLSRCSPSEYISEMLSETARAAAEYWANYLSIEIINQEQRNDFVGNLTSLILSLELMDGRYYKYNIIPYALIENTPPSNLPQVLEIALNNAQINVPSMELFPTQIEMRIYTSGFVFVNQTLVSSGTNPNVVHYTVDELNFTNALYVKIEGDFLENRYSNQTMQIINAPFKCGERELCTMISGKYPRVLKDTDILLKQKESDVLEYISSDMRKNLSIYVCEDSDCKGVYDQSIGSYDYNIIYGLQTTQSMDNNKDKVSYIFSRSLDEARILFKFVKRDEKDEFNLDDVIKCVEQQDSFSVYRDDFDYRCELSQFYIKNPIVEIHEDNYLAYAQKLLCDYTGLLCVSSNIE